MLIEGGELVKLEVNLGGFGETLCAEVCELPGCIAIGSNFDELLESLRDSIRFYLGEGAPNGADPGEWPLQLAGMQMIGGRASMTVEVPDRHTEYPGT
jgi:predicted RNase H-like HicB family nuclease